MTRGRWFSFFFGIKHLWTYLVLLMLFIVGLLLALEMQTSAFQAHYFSKLSSKANFTVGEGVSSSISFPSSAPYDDRLGYSKIPGFVEKLKARGFEITRQAQISRGMAEIVSDGYFAPYPEKVQSGLRILDCRNDSLFQERYPKRIFERFEDIAPMLVQSLLFIENRELLNSEHPKRNPAVEWDRLANAVLLKAKGSLTGDSRSPGGSTLEAQENIGMEVAEKLARYSDNGTTTSSINLPAVALPEHGGKHRLLHIHRNVPGVMSAINNVFSENRINVSAQFLQTRDTMGYVVIDIDAEYSEIALKKLAAIEGTIRSRVLF